MSIFRRPDYQSDTTQFINQLKARLPGLEKQQLAGPAYITGSVIDVNGGYRMQ
ncbi:DUF3460 family protein [Verminephrobacter sp. Larva24]|nr:DUF3460 family protein [Verminephrobacter sp. Larva24]